ncbi:CsbD family protein [Rothia nasisuis]|uniref:CsbD family protein n=1 Tax=Rothia nasisuis TaxID=2109647 RepID=UPI001F23A963|nr:CsbD family protein [Rothia nasisuis]
MSAGDKIKNGLDNLTGKAKEAGGKLTGNERLEAEGKADQLQAQAQDKVDDAKNTVAGIKDSFKKD